MTLARLNLGFAISFTTLALAACDAKEGSVSGTATGGTSSGGGTDTVDDPSGTGVDTNDTEGAGKQCAQNETVIGLDEESIVGLTPQQLLDEVVGTYSGAMQWLQEGPVQFEGDPGPTGVEIEITYDGGEARSVEGELVSSCNHDGPCPCPDSLEVDVGLRFTSEDSVFAEQFDVELVYEVDDSGFSGGGYSIRFRFQPDETAGTFSAGALDISDESLQYLELGLQPAGGAMGGSINAAIEGMGSFGFGVIASIGTVQDPEACSTFYSGGSACGLAGCAEVSGRPVYGSADSCSCGDAQTFCFPAPLEGDDALTLYTRPSQYEDGFDDVVEFGVSTELGGDWRACADAPDVDLCSCVSCG